MRLIQFFSEKGDRQVGLVRGSGGEVDVIKGVGSTYTLAMTAINSGRSLVEQVAQYDTIPLRESYEALLAELRLLVPLDHEDPSHCLVSGTGLTHLGSASTRDAMHGGQSSAEYDVTDTMRMFRLGINGGKPVGNTPGVQPEWFYKGDGNIVVPPGSPIVSPDFAEDAGEEPEIVGMYLVSNDGKPYRLGFAIGNEFSDHIMERRNYLYLAHSKLRSCSFGPELRVGALPNHIEGMSRILRDDEILWERPILSGEANMSHTLENLEYHHFKYDQFLRPGTVHLHFFGTATLSFTDGIRTQSGDVFEIHAPEFGVALRNPVASQERRFQLGGVVQL